MSITNATAREEDDDGERGQDRDGASLLLQSISCWSSRGRSLSLPSNLDSDCEWRFIVVPRPGTKDPTGVSMLYP